MRRPQFGRLITIKQAAWLVQRSEATIWTWVHQKQITHTACDVATKRVLVDAIQAHQLAEQRSTRRRVSLP